MSMDDIDWRRSLFIAAGLAILAIAVMIIFVIPYLRNSQGLNRGPEWIFVGIQLFIAAILFGAGYINKRDGCLTRILLLFTGILAIITSFILILSISDVPELKRYWAIWIYSIDDFVIGILAIRALI